MIIHSIHGFNVDDEGGATTDTLTPLLEDKGHEVVEPVEPVEPVETVITESTGMIDWGDDTVWYLTEQTLEVAECYFDLPTTESGMP